MSSTTRSISPALPKRKRRARSTGRDGSGSLRASTNSRVRRGTRGDISIPDAWRGKRITLMLERTKFTKGWIDGKPIGQSPILCTPQEYVLGTVEPGRHRLTIMVDNSRLPVPGDNHQTSDNTQGNWNGIIGRIELRRPMWSGSKTCASIRTLRSDRSRSRASWATRAAPPAKARSSCPWAKSRNRCR